MSEIETPIRDAAIRHLVAERAYELWENQGRPHGHDVIHWHQAEREVCESLEQASAARERPPEHPAPARPSRSAVTPKPTAARTNPRAK
jgi:hypothetical protein